MPAWIFQQRRVALANAKRTTHRQPSGDAAAIAALAEETRTDEAVVQGLYEEERAALEARSSVKTFIGVIAARRVKARLTALREESRPVPTPAERRPHAA
jgi:hypothetical protein